MEIVLSSASHHAMLFAFLAQETIHAFAADGEEAVLAGVQRYGYQRGHRMALRATEDGLPLNALTFLLYGEWEAFPGQVERKIIEFSPQVRVNYYRCPWYAEWERRNLLDCGAYYCENIDAALLSGFNGGNLELTTSRPSGEARCDFHFIESTPLPGVEAEQFRLWERALGNRAKMPWEYHTGHIFNAMRYAVLERFSEAGEEAIGRALARYTAEYGGKATELVLQYADLDYDVLPPYDGMNGISL